ncbi:MAG: hypothetical protein MUC88_07410 [Planctomycetes bacterium]|nr:hypothetical protein [Planctomycetota bacterium]
MKKARRQMGLSKPAVLVLLPLVMTLNASPVTTLCVRPDGRVAVEPVIHDQCTCDAHACGAASDPAAAGLAAHHADGPCQPCTDLSVPVGSCQGRAAPDNLKAGRNSPVAVLPPFLSPVPHGMDMPSPDPPPAPARHDPLLDSTVLLV